MAEDGEKERRRRKSPARVAQTAHEGVLGRRVPSPVGAELGESNSRVRSVKRPAGQYGAELRVGSSRKSPLRHDSIHGPGRRSRARRDCRPRPSPRRRRRPPTRLRRGIPPPHRPVARRRTTGDWWRIHRRGHGPTGRGGFSRRARHRDRVRSCPPSRACHRRARSAGTRCPSDRLPAVRGV